MTAVPPPPAYPPTSADPVEWWSLKPAPAPADVRVLEPREPRLPDWRTAEKPTADQLVEEPTPDEEPDPEPEAEQPEEDDPAEPDDAEDADEQPDEDAASPPPLVTPPAPTAPTAPQPRPRNRVDLAKRRHQLLYNAAAAGAGWTPAGTWPGAGQWIHQCMTYYGQDQVRDGIVCGLIAIAITVPVDMRGRRWRHDTYPLLRALGWLLRIPLATAVLALALYTPDATL